MKYWVIENQYDDTVVTAFENKEDAIDYLKTSLNDPYADLGYYTIIEGKELKISRTVNVEVSAE